MAAFSIEYTMPKGALSTGRGSTIVEEELRAATAAGLQLVRNQIVPGTPRGVTSILAGGNQTEIRGEGVDILGRVFNPVLYAVAVEKGTVPHFPPYKQGSGLYRWVEKVMGIGGKETARVAFLVARKIGQHGTRARNFFRDGTQRARGPVLARFSVARDRIVARWGA